mmetsp:Transcript_27375/g.66470  ORF Transcript_27375/g.66470 Transcript_27375/m.66470 type:complete len:243 (+) Transcript_27375:785-1513(+)
MEKEKKETTKNQSLLLLPERQLQQLLPQQVLCLSSPTCRHRPGRPPGPHRQGRQERHRQLLPHDPHKKKTTSHHLRLERRQLLLRLRRESCPYSPTCRVVRPETHQGRHQREHPPGRLPFRLLGLGRMRIMLIPWRMIPFWTMENPFLEVCRHHHVPKLVLDTLQCPAWQRRRVPWIWTITSKVHQLHQWQQRRILLPISKQAAAKELRQWQQRRIPILRISKQEKLDPKAARARKKPKSCR